MFNGLMCGPIFSKPNRIVGHDVDDSGFGQGGDSHGCSHVIGEDEESGTVGDESRAVKSNSITDGSHSVFTDSEPHIAFFGSVLLEVSEHLEKGHVGGGKISTASDESRENLCKSIQICLR